MGAGRMIRKSLDALYLGAGWLAGLFMVAIFLLMMAISMVAPMFTWFMILVTHLYSRRRYRGEALAFRMWGYPATSLLGAALMLGALLTTAFTSAFRMTLACGVPFLLALTLAYRFWFRGRVPQRRAEGEALG